ncbi:TPA: 5'-nucleotidase, partial [Yersinia enterocolitica]
MSLDLSNTLVIGISATALYDMSESDCIFRETYETDPDGAIEKYRAYMLEHENNPLEPGTGFPLVKALLGLNRYRQPEDKSPLVEVVVMSRNSPDTGIRVLNTIRYDKLNITRSAFTAGETVA